MSSKTPIRKEKANLKSAKKPNTHSGRFTDLDVNKLRGGYYTSNEVAKWLCSWAIRSSKDLILEPSCGDGVFLEAAAHRYMELGARHPTIARRVTGIEIVEQEALRARDKLISAIGKRPEDPVVISDFFDWWQNNEQLKFDAVVGNPPFIRYQTFPEPHRSRAMTIMGTQGLSPNRLTKFDNPKIILPILSTEPRYAFDDADIVVTGGGNGPYYMIRPREQTGVSNLYLMAVLNHPLSEAFVRTNTSTFRGGYYSHGKQFIENLPVPLPADPVRAAIETAVSNLIDTMDAIAQARTPHRRVVLERRAVDLRTQIEALVTGSFGLSSDDMELVRAVSIPE